jgi:hypothetical protein
VAEIPELLLVPDPLVVVPTTNTETVPPATVTLPEDGVSVYPVGPVTEYAYDPFVSGMEMVALVATWGVPPSVTVQVAPDASPEAVKETA